MATQSWPQEMPTEPNCGSTTYSSRLSKTIIEADTNLSDRSAILAQLHERYINAYHELIRVFDLVRDDKGLLNVPEEGMKRFGSCSPFFQKAYEAAIARSRARETQIMKLMSRKDAPLHLGSGFNRNLAYPFAHAKYPSRDNNVIEAARKPFSQSAFELYRFSQLNGKSIRTFRPLLQRAGPVCNPRYYVRRTPR